MTAANPDARWQTRTELDALDDTVWRRPSCNPTLCTPAGHTLGCDRWARAQAVIDEPALPALQPPPVTAAGLAPHFDPPTL